MPHAGTVAPVERPVDHAVERDEDPGARWMRLMREGRWADAWVLSDEALQARAGTPSWHLPRHQQWIWDGTAFDGRHVLVRCYHGLGDTLQFAQLLPALRARAATVTVWAQPALLGVLATAAGIDRLRPLHDGAPDVPYDVDVEIMELAHALRVTPETLPHTVPYLHVPRAARTPDGTVHVGLVWSCGDWNQAQRSIPFAALAPLFAVPGVTVHVLQRGPALAECPPNLGVHDATDDVLDTARRVRSLDLVLSVDTMMAHLAGALAVPVWVLLPHDADWRWMAHRDTSPWYPTARLIRQPTPDDWPAVIAQVAHELGARTIAPD